jgi:hypothetical protein
MKLLKFSTTAFLLVFISLSYSIAQGFTNLNDCLVTTNIGKYIYDVKTARLGNASGVVGGAGHFKVDHVDSICSGEYSNINEVIGLETREEIVNKLISVDVQVTQHTSGDSDRWLLHEVEDSYRDSDMETLGLLTDGTVMRKVDNNRVLWLGIGGASFTWVSNKVVIKISYTDLQGTKPEPSEVVQAYLAKFPSTITMTDAELKASAHNIQWIKDEIDRRLWLCDKWNAQYQAGQATQKDLIYNLNRSLKVFLNYRQKYYGVSARDDLKALSGYDRNNDIASFQTKLTEYKTWWGANKGKSISLP